MIHTKRFFEILEMPFDSLESPVKECADREDYQQMEEVVRHLRMMNDQAERMVKLMKDYNNGNVKRE